LAVPDNRIRQVDADTEKIKTIAGNGNSMGGDGGLAINAGLIASKIACDIKGNIYISQQTTSIRRIDANTGIINRIAGNGSTEFSGEGKPAIDAGLGNITSLVINSKGDIFIGATSVINSNFIKPRVWRIDGKTGIITILVDSNNAEFSGDGGSVTNASISGMPYVALDKNENLLILSANFKACAVRLVKLQE
jgi:hypothetical protein